MAEYANIPVQVVEPNQNAILYDVIPCQKGYVVHREGSGIVILRGIVNNACGSFARYQVTFNGNIALPETAEIVPISIALALDGEPLQSSRAIATPAAVDEYFNVTSTGIITVPRGCCFTIAVENVTPADGATVAQPISIQNANLVVSRIA